MTTSKFLTNYHMNMVYLKDSVKDVTVCVLVMTWRYHLGNHTSNYSSFLLKGVRFYLISETTVEDNREK